MDNVNPPKRKQNLVEKNHGLEECRQVFTEKSAHGSILELVPVPVDANAIEHDELLAVFPEHRTQNRHVCPEVTKGKRDVPHPPVEWNGFVLNNQQNMLAS